MINWNSWRGSRIKEKRKFFKKEEKLFRISKSPNRVYSGIENGNYLTVFEEKRVPPNLEFAN